MERDVTAIVEGCERAFAAGDVFGALRLLNSTTCYRFTGLYRFESGWVRSVALFDRKNPSLMIGVDVPWDDSYCMLTAEDGTSYEIESSLDDPRLTTHPAREALQSYVAVLLRAPDDEPLGTLCHFDVVPHPSDGLALRCLLMVRPSVERTLWSMRPAPRRPRDPRVVYRRSA